MSAEDFNFTPMSGSDVDAMSNYSPYTQSRMSDLSDKMMSLGSGSNNDSDYRPTTDSVRRSFSLLLHACIIASWQQSCMQGWS